LFKKSEEAMNHRKIMLGLVLIMVAALGLAACGTPSTAEKEEPVELVEQGDGRNLVILTDKAAERLDVQTDTVREEEITVKRSFGGEVTEASADSGAMVMVSLTSDERNMVNSDVPAVVFPLGSDDEEDTDNGEGLTAEFDEMAGLDDPEENGVATLYYSINDSAGELVTGQRLVVEISMKGAEGPRLIVPTAALLYDLNGETWIYTSPEPLHFLREPVVVDYIIGDQVVLTEGPSAGTAVAVVGVAELFGADTGVGK
jgi:hypothetical protein